MELEGEKVFFILTPLCVYNVIAGRKGKRGEIVAIKTSLLR